MAQKKTPQQILAEYEKKANDILFEMYQILQQAQRKIEDPAYRKIMEKIGE